MIARVGRSGPLLPAAVDAEGLAAIRALAWVDVLNAGVWLQEHGRYKGLVLKTSNLLKVFLYATLFVAAADWGLNGDFVDFWDAFLWLVAFVFIELNVFEWRMETRKRAEAAA